MTSHEDPRQGIGGRFGLGRLVTARRIGLSFMDEVPFGTWQRVGKQIALISDASTWWLGDWLVYGEDKYPGRYKKAIAETALDYQTLRNYAWVARKFKLSRRRDSLSLQHHEVVAALPERQQDVWLDRAEVFRWSRNELRRQVRLGRADDNAPAARNVVTLRLNLTPLREQRWQYAADAVDRDLREWIADVVDAAAESALQDSKSDLPKLVRPA